MNILKNIVNTVCKITKISHSSVNYYDLLIQIFDILENGSDSDGEKKKEDKSIEEARSSLRRKRIRTNRRNKLVLRRPQIKNESIDSFTTKLTVFLLLRIFCVPGILS